MLEFLFKDCSQFSDRLKELTGDYNSPNFIHSIRFDNYDHTVDVHVCPQLFKHLVDSCLDYNVRFFQDCVYLSITQDNITLTACLLKYQLYTDVSELDKPIEQLYEEYCERTGWPYVHEKQV